MYIQYLICIGQHMFPNLIDKMLNKFGINIPFIIENLIFIFFFF